MNAPCYQPNQSNNPAPRRYENFKANHESSEDLEFVFVSSDNNADAFQKYYAEMPWLALAFDMRAADSALSKHFKVGRAFGRACRGEVMDGLWESAAGADA